MTPEVLLAVWLVFGNPDDVKKPEEVAVVLWAGRERAEAHKMPLADVLRRMTAYNRRTPAYWRAVMYMSRHAAEYDLTDEARELLKGEAEQAKDPKPGWTKQDTARLKAATQLVKRELDKPLSASPLGGATDFGKPGQPVYDAIAEHRELKPTKRLGCWQLYKEVEP